MIVWFARLALAQDPVPVEAIVAPEPSPELLELRATLEALQQTHDRTASEVEVGRRELGRVRVLLESAAILLDDRQPFESRTAAADTLADTGDPRAVPILRAGARDRDPEIQLASATAALRLDSPAGLEVVHVVLVDEFAPKDTRTVLIQRLANHGTDAAGEMLFAVSSDRDVPARVRAAALDELDERYPEILARHGGRPSVVDPFAGLLFVAANGVAGGVLLSSVGSWGQLDDGATIGGVGGTAVGLIGGTLYAVSRPVSSGQALAYASGVGWGYTYGRWTTGATLGSLKYVGWEERERIQDVGRAYGALGVLGGMGLGAYAVARDPTPADVLEIDLAGYLGSAIVLGATDLVGYRPPPEDPSSTFPRTTVASTSEGTFTGAFPLTPYETYKDAAFQRRAASSLVGGTIGLVSGALLLPQWEVEGKDLLFAGVIGGQAAWLGNYGPPLVGADRSTLAGYIRLPWNAAMAGGLLTAELVDVPAGRSLSTAWGSVTGDALGAGLPMVLGYDDERSVASWMVPVGALGTVGGLLAHPVVAPTGGDAVMVGVGTSIALSEGLMVGLALDDLGALADSGQAPGLMLTAAGAAGVGLYGLSAVVDPRADRMLALGSAAAWGTFYGALVPAAVGATEAASWLLPASATSAAATVGIGLAMRAENGLEPRSTVIPQLAAASGATLGALSAGVGSADGQDAAIGGLVGATVGFAVGAAIEVGTAHAPATTAGIRWSPRLPGIWTPLVQPHLGADGSMGAVAGVQAVGW